MAAARVLTINGGGNASPLPFFVASIEKVLEYCANRIGGAADVLSADA
jgi:hypothetical protein